MTSRHRFRGMGLLLMALWRLETHYSLFDKMLMGLAQIFRVASVKSTVFAVTE